jgi:hypothetical protein
MRVEKEITWNVLLFSGDEEENENKGRKHLFLRIIRETVQSPIDLMIWRDRVGILIYGDEPYVLDISGAQTVQGFREYFEVLWNKSELL